MPKRELEKNLPLSYLSIFILTLTLTVCSPSICARYKILLGPGSIPYLLYLLLLDCERSKEEIGLSLTARSRGGQAITEHPRLRTYSSLI